MPDRKRLSILVFMLAMGLRLGLLAVLQSHPTFFNPNYVTDQWDQIAQNLIDGRGFSWVLDGSVPTITRGPGYAVFLAGLMLSTGHNLLFMRILYIALDSFMAVVVMWLSRRLFRDNGAALASGLFYAFFLLPSWHAIKFSPDCMFSFVLLMQMLVLLRLLDTPPRRNVVPASLLCGVTIGIAILTRKMTVVLCPLWCTALILRRWRVRTTVLSLATCILAASLVIAPWLYRNYKVAGEIAPTETLTWFNYWYGDIADRKMESMGTAEFSHTAAQYIGEIDNSGVYLPYALAPAADLARERTFRSLAIRDIRENPGHVLAKAARNIPRWWYLAETGRTTRYTKPLAAVIAGLFVCGVIVAQRRRWLNGRSAVPLLTVVLLNLVYAPVFAIMRYMVPAVPYIALFAGIAVAEIGGRAWRYLGGFGREI